MKYDQILNSISIEIYNFLTNDMNIRILKESSIEDFKLSMHTSLVEFTGNNCFKIIISVEEHLFNLLFDKIVTLEIEESQKEEFIDDLSNEITNTIVGLAIRHFPLEYQSLVLGVPYKIDGDSLSKGNGFDIKKSFEIRTSVGYFTCSVAK